LLTQIFSRSYFPFFSGIKNPGLDPGLDTPIRPVRGKLDQLKGTMPMIAADARRKMFAACLAAALLCGAAPAAAVDKEEAKKHFEAGITLLKAEDFEGAATAFETSVRLFPTGTSLFNLANCYKALHRYGESLEVLHRLEAEFAGRLGDELKSEVRNMRESLERVVGRLEVAATPAGASIRVDGRDAGKSPLEAPLVLGPGEHEIEAAMHGYTPEKRTVRVEPRSKTGMLFELQQLPADGPAAEPEPGPAKSPPEEPVPAGHGALWTGGWAVTGIGAALLVAGGITGGLALSAGNQLESDYPDGVPRADEDKVDRMDRLAVATNVLLGVGGAAVVAGVVLLVLDDGPGESAVILTPAAGPGFAGAALTGRF
jgi:hypothetical protein